MSTAVENQGPTFLITENLTTLYVPIVTLSTQDDAKLLAQLEHGKVKHESRVTSYEFKCTSEKTKKAARLKGRVERLKARVGKLKAQVRRLKAQVEAMNPQIR